jgi:A/G-specific adenine glycosylase
MQKVILQTGRIPPAATDADPTVRNASMTTVDDVGKTIDIPFLRQKLTEWYRINRRDLPWRETDDPYAIWVSEVMLQQTQVKTAVPYYHRFMGRFPDLGKLAAAELQEVLKYWEGLGYYGRARNLHHAVQTVVADLGGIIPDTFAEFRRLKGVGEYIASAVMSIAFDRPFAVVDGNVKRVLARLHQIADPVNRAASQKVFRQRAEILLDADNPGVFNQAVMELGALICKPGKPECPSCPIRLFCRASAAGTVGQYPRRIKRAPIPSYTIAVGVVIRNDRMLITLRKPEGLLGGLWEFPGGKLQNGETPEVACVREIAEETGLKIRVVYHLTRITHAYTHFKISMDVFVCRYESGKVTLDGPRDHRWIRPEEIEQYPFPGANHKFIPMLRERFPDTASFAVLNKS